jgi:hypothetical protein
MNPGADNFYVDPINGYEIQTEPQLPMVAPRRQGGDGTVQDEKEDAVKHLCGVACASLRKPPPRITPVWPELNSKIASSL